MKRIWPLPKIEFTRFSDIAEKRPTLLLTSEPAWSAVKDHLRGLTHKTKVEVYEANTAHWDALLNQVTEETFSLEVVYAVGGGLVADAAKYLAANLDLPLVCLPTAISVDAFLTPAAGFRRAGCVFYLETPPPHTLFVDFKVIAAAPVPIRAAGITDVLSIATGSWDWKFAHERGKNPEGMAFNPWVYESALSFLRGALECAEAAGKGDQEGLKTLLDCLCLEVQLCNQIGHSRPEEGSEHYFAYLLENYVGHRRPHGDLVGPGILYIAEKQGQDITQLRRALEACHIPLDWIPPETLQRTWRELPAYCHEHGLDYGLAHELT